MRKNTKPSKVVVVSEYSLSEVTVSQFTAALNQNIHPLFTYTETAASVLVQHYGYCIVFLCVCLQTFLLCCCICNTLLGQSVMTTFEP